MTNRQCDIFYHLFFYKNFLTRKRQWILTVVLQIAIPLFLFVTMWHLGDWIPNVGSSHPDHWKSTKQCKVNLFIVPSNRFTAELADRMHYCLGTKIKNLDNTGPEGGPCHYVSVEKHQFDSENDIFNVYRSYHPNSEEEWSGYAFTAALIFDNGSANFYENNLKYTLKMPVSLSREMYAKPPESLIDLTYEKGYASFQLCVDEEYIKMKKNDPRFKLQIDSQEMKRPLLVKPDIADEKLRQTFLVVLMLTFLITLCVETSFVANEKFFGTNMLMSLNDVPYCLNLLSWLTTGLLSSLFYTVPIAVLAKYHSSWEVLPLLQYGNSFLFWIMLTLNVAHVITFGMHVSAYFTRPRFAIIAALILYASSTVLVKYGIEEYPTADGPIFEIIFPNIILFRTYEEFVDYEHIDRIVRGLSWSNMFQVGNDVYGVQGSVGMLLVFSILGIIFHFAMANYVYAMDPGKYGIKKSPFCFCKFLINLGKSTDYDKVENIENNSINNQLFESTQKDCIPQIQVQKLTKSYRVDAFSRVKKCALRDVNIDFYENQTTVLLGYNGSGKSTLLSILTGSIPPSEGLVLINGKNIRNKSDEAIETMGFCHQENVLFQHLTVFQQLCFFNMLKNPDKPKRLVNTEVQELLDKLRLTDKKGIFPEDLSNSEKRSICLGIALIGNPKILILDEPTLGLDRERKRDFWNLLLRMNESKTILMSTSDMEEASVLADRVAMLHEGEVKCYGTPNYLKSLLGQGNLQITLDTETQVELENICDYFDPESEVIRVQYGKIVLSVPNNNELPNSLDKIERDKKELGITAIDVSSFSLEKVYLEVIYDNCAPLASREPSCSTVDKLDNDEHSSRNILKALLRKKASYSRNNTSTIVFIALMFLAAYFCAVLVLSSQCDRERIRIPIKLDMYSNVTAMYSYYANVNTAKKIADNYRAIVQEHHGEAVYEFALQNMYLDDAFSYTYNDLVAAEFRVLGYNDDEIITKALYNSERARFAMPISINLVSNAVLKTFVGNDHSIEVHHEELRLFSNNVLVDDLMRNALFDGYVVAGILAFFIFPATALFSVHPIRESLSNVKLLQRISGVSGFAYWAIMFVVDVIIFIVISILFILLFRAFDVSFLHVLGWQEAFILLLLLILFAMSVLPLIYIVTFWKSSTGATISRLSLLPLYLVLVEVMIITVKFDVDESTREFWNEVRPYQKGLFLLAPYVSFYHGGVSLFNNAKVNSECRKMTNIANERVCELTPCCNIKCHDGVCSDAVPYFKNFEDDVALETSVLAMGLTFILYFTILMILEYKLVQKLLAKVKGGMPDNSDETFEQQVKKVKHEIAFEASKVRENVSKKEPATENLNNVENGTVANLSVSDDRKDYEFFVFELRKLYKKLVAVEDVSFGMEQNECFGIFGASGAGKTTILKIVTGEEIPNHGMVHLRAENHLSRTGYCPQNDSLIRTLNAYDHLRLFARLRGVSERKIDREVSKWVERLNLNDCASQPIETFSSGNKKRLNIGMALIGHPKLVLLDEPTKHLDPATKQLLWKIIQSCQVGQVTLLASDSMEECLTLCKSLATMAKGRFTNIGPADELKQRFRAGYDVQFKLHLETADEEIQSLKKSMSEVLPCRVMDEINGCISFHVLPVEKTWRQMYDLLFDMKDKFSCIEEFYLLTSMCEQLFSLFFQPIPKTDSQNQLNA